MHTRDRRGAGWALGLALAFGIGLWSQTGAQAEAPSRSSRPPRVPSAGETGGEVDTKKLDAKLDQILANQEKLFQRLDEVMEELKIVKVRATLN